MKSKKWYFAFTKFKSIRIMSQLGVIDDLALHFNNSSEAEVRRNVGILVAPNIPALAELEELFRCLGQNAKAINAPLFTFVCSLACNVITQGTSKIV